MQIKRALHSALLVVALAVWCHCADDDDGATKRLLSRKRRYLIFPEGSSFQLIYDQIIPIVDYTNLFIFGVTTALAWPLPAEPFDMAKLREIYANGTLPDIRRVDANTDHTLQSSDTTSGGIDNFVYNQNDVYYSNPVKPSAYSKYDDRPAKPNNPNKKANFVYGKNDIYYKNHRYNSEYPTKRPYNKKESSKYGYYFEGNDPNAQLYNQIDRNYRRPYKPWQTKSGWGQTAPTAQPHAARHIVYPVIGRRSVRELGKNHDPEERLSLHHHRATRHTLYESIERYLEAHGNNGTECVRKVLCETAQKRRETRPGSFVGELLRVVFSLPDISEEPIFAKPLNRVRREYDDSYHGQHDCERKFASCPGSLWGSFYTT